MNAATKPGNQTRAGNIPALERASGRDWAAWVQLFEGENAKSLDHAAIARIARAAMPEGLENPDWWAQGAAIAYEQHAGLRVPGQSASGTFRVSASRTLARDRDTALADWVTAHGELTAHLGHAVQQARTSRTEKRSFYRFNLEGAGKVEVAATAKDETRVILSINHTELASDEQLEAWRAHWKGLLAAL